MLEWQIQEHTNDTSLLWAIISGYKIQLFRTSQSDTDIYYIIYDQFNRTIYTSPNFSFIKDAKLDAETYIRQLEDRNVI